VAFDPGIGKDAVVDMRQDFDGVVINHPVDEALLEFV
jgi:hypothetical protein